MSQSTPQNVLLEYKMSGQLTTNSGPNAYEMVYWLVYNTPDFTGALSGYQGRLQNIQIATVTNISNNQQLVVPTSPALGDLSGNYPNPTVIGLDGYALGSGALDPADGDILIFNGTTKKWEPGPNQGGFTASGDLTGNQAGQQVRSISGAGGLGGTLGLNVNELQFAANQSSPTITQLTGNSTGNNLSIIGQSVTGDNIGGSINIYGGDSQGGNSGSIYISPGINETLGDRSGLILIETGNEGAIGIFNQNGDSGLVIRPDAINLFSIHGLPISIGNTSSGPLVPISLNLVDGYGWIGLDANGISFPVTTVESDLYTIDTTVSVTTTYPDYFLLVNFAGEVDIELPPGAMKPGRILVVKDISGHASTNNINLNAQPAGDRTVTIDGSVTVILDQDYQSIELTSDGANWFIKDNIGSSDSAITGDVTGTLSSSTVAKLQNVDVQSGVPRDGYVLTYSSVASAWKPEAITSGSVTLGGDLTGPTTSNNLTSIQGTALSATLAGITSNQQQSIQYNGTQWQNVGAPPQITIWGQNDVSMAGNLCLDDVPLIQAAMDRMSSQGGVINLHNVVLRSQLDFSGSGTTGTTLTFRCFGQCRWQVNAGEIDTWASGAGQSSPITFDGASGGVGSASTISTCSWVSFRSDGGVQAPDLNYYTTDGYVDGYYWSMWTMTIDDGYAALSTDLIGQTLTITSSTGNVFNGDWILAHVYGKEGSIYTTPTCRIVWQQGQGAAPDSSVGSSFGNIAWSVGSGPSLRTGIAGTINDFGNYTICLQVHNMKNLTNESAHHWITMGEDYFEQIYGQCQPNLYTKLHRIMGISSSTSAFIIGNNLQAKGTTILPDYGVGGTSSAPNIHCYECVPLFRFGWNNSCARNMSITGCFVGIVIDGNPYGITSGQINNIAFSGNYPIIIDSAYQVQIDHISFSPLYFTANWVILLTATCGITGQYTALIDIDNVYTFNGGGIMVVEDSGVNGTSNVNINKLFIDPAGNPIGYPASIYDWVALVTIDGGVAPVWKVTNSGFADPSGSIPYVFESINPPYDGYRDSVNMAGGGFYSENNNGSGFPDFKIMGPNLAGQWMVGGGFDNQTGGVLSLNEGFTALSNNPWYVALSNGMIDASDTSPGSDGGPVLTLPFRLSLPPLKTVADWEALIYNGTTPIITNTDANGNPLYDETLRINPNLIRISTTTDLAAVRIPVGPSTLIPQVGDTVLVYFKIKTTDAGGLVPGSSESSNYLGTEFAWFSTGSGGGLGVFGVQPTVDFSNRVGGLWLESCTYTTIISTQNLESQLYLYFGPTLFGPTYDDIVIDPDSIVCIYIPGSYVTDGYIAKDDIIRVARKLRRQVAGATVGDLAIYENQGLSFGGAAREGVVSLNTTSTSPQTIYSYTVPTGGCFQVSLHWTAVRTALPIFFSSGQAVVSGNNVAGAITVSSVQAPITDYQTGSAGAAATTPITVSVSGTTVHVLVTSQSSVSTDWQARVSHVKVS